MQHEELTCVILVTHVKLYKSVHVFVSIGKTTKVLLTRNEIRLLK